jgi:hypothetical protein
MRYNSILARHPVALGLPMGIIYVSFIAHWALQIDIAMRTVTGT